MLLGFRVQHGTVRNLDVFEDSALKFSSMAKELVTLSDGPAVKTPTLGLVNLSKTMW